jgi:hypothetical protein
MHAPLVEGHFTDESGQSIKPHVVEDYNAYMGFVDKSDRMVNSYGSGPSWGRPSPFASQLGRLEVKHSQHWPSKGKQLRYCVCSLHKQTQSTLYFCRKCDVGLCIVNCFEKWHTHVNLSH